MPHQCLKCGVLFNEGSTIILRGCPECRGTRFFYTQIPLTMSERDKLLATSEITLRDAIDQLVKKAKDGQQVTDDDGAQWVLSGPPATKVVADAAMVPDDLPVAKLSVDVDEKKLVVKVPNPAKSLRKNKREPVRWDYEVPDPRPTAPPPARAPEISLKVPPAFQAAPTPIEPPMDAPAPAPKATTTNPTLEAFLPPVPAVAPSPPTPIGIASRPATDTVDPEIAPNPDAPETIRISKPGEYEIDVKRLLESNPIVIQRDGTYLIHLASLFEAKRPKAD